MTDQIIFSDKEINALREGMEDCDLHTTSHIKPEDGEEDRED